MATLFNALRFSHELKIRQLEQEVYECCRKLKILKSQRDKQEKIIHYAENKKHFYWQFDMSEFTVDNIKLDLVDRCISLSAHRTEQGQFVEVNRKFLLPQNAARELSAKMTRNGILTIQASKEATN